MKLFREIDEFASVPDWFGTVRVDGLRSTKTVAFAPLALAARFTDWVASGVRWKWFRTRKAEYPIMLNAKDYTRIRNALNASGAKYTTVHVNYSEAIVVEPDCKLTFMNIDPDGV